MTDASTLGLLVLAGCGLVVLAELHRRHLVRVRRDRASLFESCSRLLTHASVVPRGLDFPVLTGRRGTRPVRVEPVVDTLSMRTVPVLWLVVTVNLPRPVGFHLSVLARSCGTEFYARHGDAGGVLATAPGWPDELAVRSDEPDLARTRPELLTRLAAFMADGRVKQVSFRDATARVVWRCAAATPSTYRVTRRVDLTGVRVDEDALSLVLDTVVELGSAASLPAGGLAGEVTR